MNSRRPDRSEAEWRDLATGVGRRALLMGVATITILPLASARATPEAMAAAIKEVAGDVAIRDGRVTLDLPPLVENGNAVPLTVAVDSPMTEADHVKAIHVFNEKNPQPHVLDVRLGPRNGKAALSTRIKLADSQKIVAIAEMSSGEFFSTSVNVIVTLAACVEDLT
jgi:sulfur-oxidizing protein SoxY